MTSLALVLALAVGQIGGGKTLIRSNLGKEMPVSGASVMLSKWDWSNYGAPSWYGAPDPNFDCVAAASSGNLTCTGSPTFTKQGAPTTTTSPLYYNAAAQPAVNLSGNVGDYFDAGDSDFAGSRTIGLIFSVDDVGANRRLYTKGGSSADVFIIRTEATSGGTVQTYWFKANGDYSQVSCGTVIPYAWNFMVLTYEYVADGTSKLRCNLNNAAITEVTTLKGPLWDSSGTVKLGSYNGSLEMFKGNIARATEWRGWAASQAQINAMVQSMTGSLNAYGEVATVTNASSEWVDYISSQKLYLAPPNSPRVYPSTGLVVFPANENKVAQSEDASTWTDNTGTPTITTDSWTWARGIATGDLFTDDDGGTQEAKREVSWTTGTLTGLWTNSCWLGAGTLTAGQLRVSTTGTGTLTCNVSGFPIAGQRYACTTTIGGAPTYSRGIVAIGNNASATGTINVAGCQHEPYGVAGPYIPVGASAPVTRNATQVTVPENTSLIPRCWSVAAKPNAPGGDWARDVERGLWSAGTFAGANSAGCTVNSSGKVLCSIYNNASAQKLWTSATTLSGTAEKKITFCTDNAGTGTLLIDGTTDAATTSGAGDGVLASVNATLNVGYAATKDYWAGYVRKLCQCKSTNALQCETECNR